MEKKDLQKKDLNIIEFYKEKESKKSQAEEYAEYERGPYYTMKSSEEEQQPLQRTIEELLSHIVIERYPEKKHKISHRDKSKTEMIKTEAENLRKKVTSIDETLERIENKIDSLIEDQNTYQPATISISFKDYESFEKAIKDIYSTDLPFETIGFKCMNINQSGENFFKKQGYEFERIDVKEYFSKKNKKHLFHEFHNYINAKYKKTKK